MAYAEHVRSADLITYSILRNIPTSTARFSNDRLHLAKKIIYSKTQLQIISWKFTDPQQQKLNFQEIDWKKFLNINLARENEGELKISVARWKWSFENYALGVSVKYLISQLSKLQENLKKYMSSLQIKYVVWKTIIVHWKLTSYLPKYTNFEAFL